MTYAEAARATVAVRARELFEHADGVLDTGDIERVHDMRVATRRLRAVLEVFAACFEPELHDEVLRDVKALADALGARRDPDVQLAALESFGAAVPPEDLPGIDVFAQRLRVEQAQGNQRLAAALDEARTHDLHGRLERLVAEPVPAPPSDVFVPAPVPPEPVLAAEPAAAAPPPPAAAAPPPDDPPPPSPDPWLNMPDGAA